MKENPRLLPPNVRIFIPTDYREHGIKRSKFLIDPDLNHNTSTGKQIKQTLFRTNSFSWPLLSSTFNVQRNDHKDDQKIWHDLKLKQEEIDKIKEEFNIRMTNNQIKYDDHLKKMNIVLLSVSQRTKFQNESVERCSTTIHEILPILSSTLGIVRYIATKLNLINGHGGASESSDTHEIFHHVSEVLEFIKDRNELLVVKQKALNNLVEQQGQPVTQGINSLISNDG